MNLSVMPMFYFYSIKKYYMHVALTFAIYPIAITLHFIHSITSKLRFDWNIFRTDMFPSRQ